MLARHSDMYTTMEPQLRLPSTNFTVVLRRDVPRRGAEAAGSPVPGPTSAPVSTSTPSTTRL